MRGSEKVKRWNSEKRRDCVEKNLGKILGGPEGQDLTLNLLEGVAVDLYLLLVEYLKSSSLLQRLTVGAVVAGSDKVLREFLQADTGLLEFNIEIQERDMPSHIDRVVRMWHTNSSRFLLTLFERTHDSQRIIVT